MKNIENKAMLITYADSMGTNLKALERVLDKHFDGVFGGVHVLPFFPSSGDRGFAVVNYDIVDPAFGTWEDIDRLGEKYYLMADFMLNHVSIRSEEFQDYMKNGEASPYRDMFIHWNEFWPQKKTWKPSICARPRALTRTSPWKTARPSVCGTPSLRSRWTSTPMPRPPRTTTAAT